MRVHRGDRETVKTVSRVPAHYDSIDLWMALWVSDHSKLVYWSLCPRTHRKIACCRLDQGWADFEETVGQHRRYLEGAEIYRVGWLWV